MDTEINELSNHRFPSQDDLLLQEILDLKHMLGEKDKLIDDLWLMKFRYDALLADEIGMIIRFTPANVITFANVTFKNYFATLNVSIIGAHISEFIAIQDIDQWFSILTSICINQPTAGCKVRFNTSHDDFEWQEWHVRGIYGRNGDLIEYQAIGHEMPEYKLPRPFGQKAYSFRKLTEVMPVLVYIYEENQVVYVNPAFEKTLGYSLREIQGKKFWDIIHPDFKESIRERGQARLRGEDVPEDYELRAVKKNGEDMWAHVFSKLTEVAGKPVSIVGIYDITERKLLSQANHELTLLNQNLNSVVNNMSDGVVILRRSGEIDVLNPAFKQTWGDVFTLSNKQQILNVLNGNTHLVSRMLDERKAFQDEEVILTTPQGQVHCLASGTPIIDEQGSVDSGVILMRPIKEVHKLVNRFSGAQASYYFSNIITQSDIMLGLIQNGKMAASSMSNVLIEGESGTGKEMFAQAIHNHSPRHRGPFVAINCGAIPKDLIGSELFGYVEGAFTGAKRGGNPGKFELASGGTIFLDEIGDMSFEHQVALLRVIQEKVVTRIGGAQSIPVDVRIICATNKNLLNEMHKGNFRQDLYYRLNVISLNLPPLRARPEDIPLLFSYFLQKADKSSPSDQINIEGVKSYLIQYGWPGNVRELQNVVERMLHVANGSQINVEQLPPEIYYNQSNHINSNASFSLPLTTPCTINEVRKKSKSLLADEERNMIINLLVQNDGNVSRVAREMGIARSTLYKKMKRYEVDE